MNNFQNIIYLFIDICELQISSCEGLKVCSNVSISFVCKRHWTTRWLCEYNNFITYFWLWGETSNNHLIRSLRFYQHCVDKIMV
jgi:hypothetical protein